MKRGRKKKIQPIDEIMERSKKVWDAILLGNKEEVEQCKKEHPEIDYRCDNEVDQNIAIIDNCIDQAILTDLFGINAINGIKYKLTIKSEKALISMFNAVLGIRQKGLILKNDKSYIFIPWADIVSIEADQNNDNG